MGATPEDSPRMIDQPAGAYGDSIGGMTIAGGISAALLARERTGETSVVDVSLLSVGAWATGLSVNIARLMGEAMPARSINGPPHQPVNPLVGFYRTADDRWICLTQLQPGRYWADTCRHLGLDHLIDDERFDTAEKIMENGRPPASTSRRRSRRRPTPNGSSSSRRWKANGHPRGTRSRWATTRRCAPTATSSRSSTPKATSASSWPTRSSSTRPRRRSRARRSSPSTPTRSSARHPQEDAPLKEKRRRLI